MSRTPTTTDTTVEWQERVTDPDSDSLTISLILDAVDDGTGFTNDGTDSSNLSWLSFSKTKNTLNDGTTEVLVDITANKSGLNQGYSYRFKITADDGTTAVDRTFTLSIKAPTYVSNGTQHFKFTGGTLYHTQSISPGFSDDTNNWSNEISYTSLDGVALPSASSGGIYISPDGKHFYLGNGNNESIEQWLLGTEWDLSTATHEKTVSPSYNDGGVWNIEFANAGKKFYLSDVRGGYVEYDVGTAYDLGTLTKVQEIANLDSNNDDLSFGISEDGKHLLAVLDWGAVRHYELETPYDLSTANNTSTYSNGSWGSSFRQVTFSPDGLRVFVVDNSEIETYVVFLNTAWDLNDASDEGTLENAPYPRSWGGGPVEKSSL